MYWDYMDKAILPVFFPTTTFVVDDKETMLNTIKTELKLGRLTCQIYSNPTAALDIVLNNKSIESFLSSYLKVNIGEEGLSTYQHEFTVDFSFYEMAYNAERFSFKSVLVIDYDMPALNAPAFLQKLKEKNISYKVILLTGAAGEKEAIELYNKGLINKFLVKHEDGVFENLIKNIWELQVQFFNESFDFFFKLLSKKFPKFLLKSNAFIDFFRNVCITKDMEQFYIIDPIGTFLLMDKNGESYWLVIKDQETLDTWCDLDSVDIYDRNKAKKITEAIKTHTKLPCVFFRDDLAKPLEQWESFLHPSQAVPNIPGFYYSLFKNTGQYSAVTKNFISYQEYLDNL